MALDMSQIERIGDLWALGYSSSEIRRETALLSDDREVPGDR